MGTLKIRRPAGLVQNVLPKNQHNKYVHPQSLDAVQN